MVFAYISYCVCVCVCFILNETWCVLTWVLLLFDILVTSQQSIIVLKCIHKNFTNDLHTKMNRLCITLTVRKIVGVCILVTTIQMQLSIHEYSARFDATLGKKGLDDEIESIRVDNVRLIQCLCRMWPIIRSKFTHQFSHVDYTIQRLSSLYKSFILSGYLPFECYFFIVQHVQSYPVAAWSLWQCNMLFVIKV